MTGSSELGAFWRMTSRSSCALFRTMGGTEWNKEFKDTMSEGGRSMMRRREWSGRTYLTQ